MKGKITLGVIIGFFLATIAFGKPPTRIRYRVEDLGSGRWQYTYDVTNNSLAAGIEEFTIWFDYGLYDNLVIETSDPPAGDWDEIVWQPDPVIESDGGYDGLVNIPSLAIVPGQTVSNFIVSFDWLGVGDPGPQFYEIVDPNTFAAIDSGYTKLSTLRLVDPNGNERLEGETPYLINWSSSGSTTDVLIEYSSDDGSSWLPVNPANLGNTGIYDWPVPRLNSVQCVVRISDANDPNIFDVSDTLFTVWSPLYVDANAPGADNGKSWADAYNYLQDALAEAATAGSDPEIYVAQGTYTPDSNSADPNGSGDPGTTFQPVNNVAIRGGYAGFGEPDPNFRDPNIYETILSGDINTPLSSDNSNYVVIGGSTNSTAILDGFTISDGRSGGIYSGNQTIVNCTISGNSSNGGIRFCNGPVINCTISGNSGGGMRDCDGPIINCTISGNFGDGIASCDGPITNCNSSWNFNEGMRMCNGPITNCNSSENLGGGIYYCDNTITNCIVSGNSANGMAYCTGPITNCIIWNNNGEITGNSTVTYSDVQGGWLGEGNIDTDPLFVDETNGDYHLLPSSLCIDAGDPNSPWEAEPSPNGSRVNMGAYGNTPEATTSRAGFELAGFKIISQIRVGRTIFQYDLSLALKNVTDSNIMDIQAKVVDGSPQVTAILDDEILFAQIDSNSTVDSNSFGDYFTVEIDHSQLITPGRLTWAVYYSGEAGAEMMVMSALIPIVTIEGDLTGDGEVNYEDLQRLAQQWLWTGEPGSIVEDVAQDGTVDFADLAKLAGRWKQ